MPSPNATDRTSAVRSFYDGLASSYDTHLTRRIYEKLVISLLKKHIPPGKRILDIGCGTGKYLHAIHPSRGLGIDISPKMVAIAQQQAAKNLSFFIADAAALSLKETFDYIIAIETIAYWPDPDAALASIRKLCTPETKVIVLSPNPFWDAPLQLLEKLGLKTADIQRNLPAKRQLHALFARHGFSVKVSRKLFGLQYLVQGRPRMP
ncbi:class I SAM-dependent methyltransferase [Candidatus Woesearchaeota archaeon]|nr:class I SAM-dependent methyltransferase [Candidatus Woesearchaeota archaeon]